MKKMVKIVEVGPRDGLQNEKINLTVSQKIQIILKLVQAGVKNIEVGAFVSAAWVPQMENSKELIQQLFENNIVKNEMKKGLILSALVPNKKGLESALETPIREIAIFGACSETFSKKNINCSVDESFERFEEVVKIAKKNKIKVRGYLSTAFGCPYEGEIAPRKVLNLCEKMLSLGVYEVSIGDTIGVATPKQVESLIKILNKNVPLKKVAMHFHDTRGTAIANVTKSLEMGIGIFDSSVGGLGGCPYAKGASGNLATEDLIYLLDRMGIQTNIDLLKLIEQKRWLEELVQRSLPTKVGNAGVPEYMV